MPASVSVARMVSTIASTVICDQGRKSNTRSSGLRGGGLSWMSIQQRSKIVVRSPLGMLSAGRREVQSAVTNSTNCRSGMWGRWRFNVCMVDVSRLSSKLGVDVEERVNAFEQSRFDFGRGAVNDV